jgi:DNA replication protein DnaC
MALKPLKEILEQSLELQDLAGVSSSTKLEEPYILTPEEEEQAMEHAIISAKKWYAWRMNRLKPSQLEIECKLDELKLEEFVDREQVLQQANSIKHQDIWHREQVKKRRLEDQQKQEELKKIWTAIQMYRLMRWTSINEFEKDLIENDDTMLLIKTLCFFLSRDPRFETELGYSLKKGLIIRGVSGLGKTYLAQCVSKNELNPVTIINMKEVERAVKADGVFEPKAKGVLYLDDVGTEEPIINHYGTKVHWFKSFIELYYLNQPFNRLILSTNISFAEIEERYTHRVRSRMKDMFNVVDIVGEDLRGL